MFRNLFNPDNGLMITMSNLTDCIFLSLFWLLGCFPLVTVGASTAALYDAVYRGMRRGDKHTWQRFFHAYKQNLKPGLLPSLGYLVVTGFSLWGGIQVWNGAVAGEISWMVFAGIAFLIFFLLGILSILFPLLSRFETTTAQLWSNTFRLGMGNLPMTLGLAVVNSLNMVLCVRFIVPLFFLPGVAALLSSFFIEPMLKPYMPQEEPVETEI